LKGSFQQIAAGVQAGDEEAAEVPRFIFEQLSCGGVNAHAFGDDFRQVLQAHPETRICHTRSRVDKCVRKVAIGIDMQVHEKTLRRRLHIFVQQT
jgi:hypothetical protein